HPQLFPKLGDCVAKSLCLQLYILQPAVMADSLRDFRKKLKTLRGFGSPGGDLVFVRRFIKGSIQFNGIKLGGVIAEFIFGAAGIKALEVGSVPFRTAYKNLESRLRVFVPRQYLGSVGMVRRQFKIDLSRIFYFSKFHKFN